MTPLALYNYILHFLLLDVNIYHDFNTWLCKTKRQHTAVKSCACFLFYLSIGMQAEWMQWSEQPPWQLCRACSPQNMSGASPGLRSAPLHSQRCSPEQEKNISLCAGLCNTCIISCIFSSLDRDVFPSLFLLLIAGRVFPYSTHLRPRLSCSWKCGQWDSLLVGWNAGDQFPRFTISSLPFDQAALKYSRHLFSGCFVEYPQARAVSSSSFPQFITIAPETQTSCCLEKLSECRSWK